MIMNLAPICLFVYNRPEHTRRVLSALEKNDLASLSTIHIFSDAAKDKESKKDVTEVREVIRQFAGFREVIITERTENFGLARSIVDGVTLLVEKYGKIIVLEDDIVTSPFFLRFMNDALSLYEYDEAVMHISGYFFPVRSSSLPDTFFYNQTSCWGWATWNRAWKFFNPDAAYLLNEIHERNEEYRFTIDGSHLSFIEQLERNVSGSLSTWAIKWQASVFLQNGLCLHPNISYVRNIGHDGSGENSGKSAAFETSVVNRYAGIEKVELKESTQARLEMREFYRSLHPGLFGRILRKIWSLI